MEALAITDGDLQQQALLSELSDNTRTAYQKGWDKFVKYCTIECSSDPLTASPDQVAAFFVHVATCPSPQTGLTLSMGTVLLYKSAVNKKYLEAGETVSDQPSAGPGDSQGLDPDQRLLKPQGGGFAGIPYRSHDAGGS